MTVQPGTILHNRYRAVRLLGQGGFGAVYRAWDTTLNVPCALKENLEASPTSQSQFTREASILATLRHPNLPRVTDYFFIPNQGQYLVMDFVEGQDLQEMLDKQGGPLAEAQVLGWIGQILDALTYLHSQTPPIIHRDIKPANIKITPQGQAMLVDFGIAKFYNPQVRTTQGAQAVTPGYSPFEQYGQGTTDVRTDIYALGATLFTLLTGKSPLESLQRVMHDPLVSPDSLNPSLTQTTVAAIWRAMQMDPNQRFQSAQEFKQALSYPAVPPPVRPSPARGKGIPRPPHTALVPSPKASSRRFLWGAASLMGIFGVLGLGILGYLLWRFVISPNASLATQTTTTLVSMVPVTPNPSSPPASASAGTTWTSPIDGMVLVYVLAGEFTMGSADADEQAASDEKPQHTVFLEAFWIDRTEVTNAMYALCVKAGVCQPPSSTSSNTRRNYYDDPDYVNYPVIYVSWQDAETYCRWAGRQLPTEAQWEKAARGVDGRIYPWGNPFVGKLVNFCDANCPYAHANKSYNDGYADTAPVGSYLGGASPYGALDMAGNVWEWVMDWYQDIFYDNSPLRNPNGPEMGDMRVIRGGSWGIEFKSVRVAARGWVNPAERFDDVGFRCVH